MSSNLNESMQLLTENNIMSHSHFKTVCTECKNIIAQCRCMYSNKSITYSTCDDCKKKTKDHFVSKSCDDENNE